MDNDLEYTPFSKDHGPFNIAETIRGCLKIREMLAVCLVARVPEANAEG